MRTLRSTIVMAVSGALVASALSLLGAVAVQAAKSGSPCAGNVCTGTMVVGGKAVQYAYTQHIPPGGELRIRLNGGAYSTTQLVSYIVFDAPSFSSWGKYENPTNGAVYLPLEDVNPGRTAYERSDPDGCASCIVDQVVTLSYPSLPPGSYTFSLSVVQNGDTGGKNDLRFYVLDPAVDLSGIPSVPLPMSEAQPLTGAAPDMDLPCADGVDNDLNYYGDCADAACDGEVGQVSPEAFCEQPEDTCSDEFDNDADGLPDCLDPDCDGKVGRVSPVAYCQYQNEYNLTSCGDGFDNDGDGLVDCVDNLSVPPATPALYCWKQSVYGCPAIEICSTAQDDDKDKSYDDAWDAQPLTGVNCQDYDCAGDISCPAQENLDADGDDADAQCFDGLDNDLDHRIDCADPDCMGVYNPGNPSQICYDKEFDLGQSYQFCANSFDDDGDGPQDCEDSDCARRFGNCGPCPEREDLTFNACADTKDNDTDAVMNCADPDCLPSTERAPFNGDSAYRRLGRFDLPPDGDDAYCALTESGSALCGDGFDNDDDGLADCADPGCAGATGPDLQVCQPAGETDCTDGKDNDADGAADCLDQGCFGLPGCAAAPSTAACRIVPQVTTPIAFTANDPTVTVRVAVTDHVDTANQIRVAGSASYESVSVIVGDNGVPDDYYPYASATDCTLSGTNVGQFQLLAIDAHAVQIFNISQPVSGFDITLSCLTPGTPSGPTIYPISLSALKTPSSTAEYGDLEFSTTLFEATPPEVYDVVAEGEVTGTVEVPFGESLRFRVVADDPNPDPTGICACDLEIGGDVYSSFDGDCLVDPASPLYTPEFDGSPAVQAQAEDGANNFSTILASSVTIDVIPSVGDDLDVAPSRPFFRDEDMHLTMNSTFFSSLTVGDLFQNLAVPTCDVYLYDANGTPLGLGTPLLSFAGTPNGNRMDCDYTTDLPATLPWSGAAWGDGQYFMRVTTSDGSGKAVWSRRAAIFMCNHVPEAGDSPENVCAKADFDRDGAAEGLFTTLYSTSPKACDNCIGLYNALQTDENANGVGDACEPNNADYGRCEFQNDIVCSCDSDAMTCPGNPALPCPQFDDDGLPETAPVEQQCIFSWGLCTLNGQVCFEDAECPGGPGVCAIGIDPDTNAEYRCYDDADCEAIDGAEGPCLNADKCENLLFPWLQTVQGNVFSGKKILAEDFPPQGQYNATFCITAKDTIVNFLSEQCGESTDESSAYDRPDESNSYASVLGRIDINGLVAGRYGQVTSLSNDATNIVFPMDRKVYVISNQDVTIGSLMTVGSGTGTDPRTGTWGNGTVIINGGDLIIDANIEYDGVPNDALWKVPSIAWIVLDDGTGTKGNIYIDKAVTDIVGIFYAEGEDGVFTVKAPDIEGKQQLTVSGAMIAKRFHFSRSYKSLTEGAERIIFDGHAIANPPPGLEDITRALPVFRDSAF